MRFPYHPDYGLPDEYRTRVVLYVLANDVASAALTFNLHKSTIYRWVSTQGEH
jgi:transposase-like protein